MIRRREFITLLGGAAAWPRVARGQSKPAIIGVLGSGSAQSSAFLIDALKQGMNESGLTEGRDYVLDVRWAEGDYTRFATLVLQLLERKSSVIIVTTIAAARAAHRVNRDRKFNASLLLADVHKTVAYMLTTHPNNITPPLAGVEQ